MNQKQTIVMWIGIIVFVLMGLFPPYLYGAIKAGCYGFAGHYFILNPPVGGGAATRELLQPLALQIDIGQLCVQWAMVAVITGGFIIAFKDKKPRDGQKE